MESASTQSLRACGSDFKMGRLRKGATTNAYNRSTQPSIPTNFEMVLSDRDLNKKGFGTTANRFVRNHSSNPGPANYPDKPGSSTVFSKKGLGTFASSTTRFVKHIHKTVTPGPGSYRASTSLTSKGMGHLFTPGQVKIQSMASNMKNPSPCAYNPKKLQKSDSCQAMFKSSTTRMEKIRDRDLHHPSPWQYNPDDAMTRTQSYKAIASSKFKQPTNSRRFHVNLYDPHSEVTLDTAPGPADYQQEAESAVGAHPSSMFVQAESDKFGKYGPPKDLLAEQPGPGAYDPKIREPQKLPVSGAVFMSEVERAYLKPEGKPPGPAFYQPATTKKRSHHLNLQKVWV